MSTIENNEKIGIQKTIRDIASLLKKKRKEIENKQNQPFKVIINGEEYNSENEILDAWGGGIITRKAMETGMKAFVDHQQNVDINALKIEIRYLEQFLEVLYGRQEVQENSSI